MELYLAMGFDNLLIEGKLRTRKVPHDEKAGRSSAPMTAIASSYGSLSQFQEGGGAPGNFKDFPFGNAV